jgi:hypothetical protein
MARVETRMFTSENGKTYNLYFREDSGWRYTFAEIDANGNEIYPESLPLDLAEFGAQVYKQLIRDA